jgi:glutamate-5-semialdehyde dehydrogenase
MQEYVKNLVNEAKAASYKVATLTHAQKTKALKAMAAALLKNKKYILAENKKDVDAALAGSAVNSFVDRLALNEARIKEMAKSLIEIAAFKDPVGTVIKSWKRPNGLKISKVRSPIGVVLIVYEARPNVTSDCAGLLLKSCNVGILRGGKDAINSNLAVAKVLQQAAKASGIKVPLFFMVDKTGHEVVDLLLKQNEKIDLVIPRGGEALIRKVVESSTIPVIKHYKGVCHIFVDKTADIKQAVKICINAKVQRPSVCNAVEKILVHKDIARKFLPILKTALDKYKVQIRGDQKTVAILNDIEAAKEEDWYAEYLDLVVAIKVVDSVDAAIAHINFYGSHHTDSILTKTKSNADKFTKEVDSACCFVNISTRFSDGGQFGLGAEIGISTDKLHARGPMGVEDLTTYKYVVTGNNLVRG